MKTPGQATLQPYHLIAKVVQSLQVLERGRSVPVGLAAGDRVNFGKEAPVVPPGHNERQAQYGAESADAGESQLAISGDPVVRRDVACDSRWLVR